MPFEKFTTYTRAQRELAKRKFVIAEVMHSPTSREPVSFVFVNSCDKLRIKTPSKAVHRLDLVLNFFSFDSIKDAQDFMSTNSE